MVSLFGRSDGATAQQAAPQPILPMTRLRQSSPLRPVSWRWERARALRAAARPPERSRDDPAVWTALEFQEQLAAGDDQSEALCERYPDLWDAYDVSQATGPTDRYTRFELEARLLARGSRLAATAEAVNMSPAAVEWYERLYYNVSDRRHSLGYLLTYGVGAKVHHGMTESDVDLIWKLFALSGGILVLEDLMSVLTVGELEDVNQLEKYYRDASKGVTSRKATMAAVALRAREPEFKLELMSLQAKYVEIGAQFGDAAGESDTILGGIRSVFQALPLRVVGPREQVPSVLPNGAELRSSQLVLASQEGAATLPSELMEVRFPSPRLADSRDDGKEAEHGTIQPDG